VNLLGCTSGNHPPRATSGPSRSGAKRHGKRSPWPNASTSIECLDVEAPIVAAKLQALAHSFTDHARSGGSWNGLGLVVAISGGSGNRGDGSRRWID
jgi:hypothetical protein